jgi:hypothetical protein
MFTSEACGTLNLMLIKSLKALLAAILSASALLLLAVAVWWFKRGAGVTLQDILFWVGALPIAFFTLGAMGRFAVRGDLTYQMSRSVSDATPEQRARAVADDLKFFGTSWLNWILAGLLLWLGSYSISCWA